MENALSSYGDHDAEDAKFMWLLQHDCFARRAVVENKIVIRVPEQASDGH